MKKSRLIWYKICVLSLIAVPGLYVNSFAGQSDTPYYELQKKHASEWAEEDKAIDTKLTTRGEVWSKAKYNLHPDG